MNRLRKSGAASDYCKEDLSDIIQKLEVSHGYTEKDIRHIINFIRKHHSYNKSQITKMLETLNVPDRYTVLHYGALFNNVSLCRCLINDFGCGMIHSLFFFSNVLCFILEYIAERLFSSLRLPYLESVISVPKNTTFKRSGLKDYYPFDTIS